MHSQATGAQRQTPSDEALVLRAQEGDTVAFGELARRYANRLYAVLVRFTADSDEAEEALQEALVRAWRSIGRFKRRSAFFTWLYRIGINEAKRRAERRPKLGTLASTENQMAQEVPDERPLPDSRAELRELRGVLEDAIKSLPPDYRLPIVLRDIEGLSTSEAAEVMELREAAFKSRLHRARMAVREVIEPYLEGDEPNAGDRGSKQ